MADQLRPYLTSYKGALSEQDGIDGDDTPLLTVSDINPDMLEVIQKQEVELT